MKTTWWAFVVLMVLGMTAFSQEFDKGKLDRYFDALADHDKFMGSVAVSRNGELVYTRSVGFTDVGKGFPLMSIRFTVLVPFPRPLHQ